LVFSKWGFAIIGFAFIGVLVYIEKLGGCNWISRERNIG
jgi:hypothetical protein